MEMGFLLFNKQKNRRKKKKKKGDGKKKIEVISERKPYSHLEKSLLQECSRHTTIEKTSP